MWIACPVSWRSSVSSPRTRRRRSSRARSARRVDQVPSGRRRGRAPNVVKATGRAGGRARPVMSRRTSSASRSAPSEAWTRRLMSNTRSSGSDRVQRALRLAGPPPPVPGLDRGLAAGPRGLVDRRPPRVQGAGRPSLDVARREAEGRLVGRDRRVARARRPRPTRGSRRGTATSGRRRRRPHATTAPARGTGAPGAPGPAPCRGGRGSGVATGVSPSTARPAAIAP